MIYSVTLKTDNAEKYQEALAAMQGFLRSDARIEDYYRAFPNNWFVDTKLDIATFNDLIRQKLGEGTSIMVLPVYRGYYGYHSKECWTWLRGRDFFRVPEADPNRNGQEKVPEKDRIGELNEVRGAKEFDEYEGADEAIAAMKQVIAGIKFRRDAQKAGLNLQSGFNNMLFFGPPGVGKTSMAQTMALALRDQLEGAKKQPVYLVEAKDVVGRYSGQSVNNLKQILDQADNGIVIFDEIDAFLDVSSYGAEILQTLNTHIGNHPNAPVVIGTLYHTKEQDFLGANMGLASRFRHIVRLSPYQDDALMKIFMRRVEEAGLSCDRDAQGEVRKMIGAVRKAKGNHFGNAREIDNIMATIVDGLAARYQNVDLFEDVEAFGEEQGKIFREKFANITINDVPEQDAKTGMYKMRTVQGGDDTPVRDGSSSTVLSFPKPAP